MIVIIFFIMIITLIYYKYFLIDFQKYNKVKELILFFLCKN